MLELLKVILFGIVEGITEWLPISSTGHLILLNEIVALDVSEEFQSMFDVVIQLGAIMAVVVLYFHKLNPLTGDRVRRARIWKLWALVILSIIPSAVVGLPLDDWMDEHLYNAWVVACALIVYGVAFLFVERANEHRTPRVSSVWKIDWKTALGIGLFQCLSLVPGTSRSGSTILGGILLGVSRPAAAEFSFFMAIPTMLGASAVKLLKFFAGGGGFTGLEGWYLLIGCLVSFLVSYFVIRALMRYVREHSFRAFGVYRIILGIAVLAYFWLVK